MFVICEIKFSDEEEGEYEVRVSQHDISSQQTRTAISCDTCNSTIFFFLLFFFLHSLFYDNVTHFTKDSSYYFVVNAVVRLGYKSPCLITLQNNFTH